MKEIDFSTLATRWSIFPESLDCSHIDLHSSYLPVLYDTLKHEIRFIFSVPSRAPSYIRLSNLEQTDVKVQWNPLSQYYANGRLLGYKVYFKEYRSYYYYSYLTRSVNTSSANVTMVILRDLKQATTYQIAVAAFTSKGEGPRSYWMSITTGNKRTSS